MCAEESEKEAVLQVPEPVGYERAVSVDHASAPLGEVGPDVEHRHGAADSRRHVVGVPVERPLQRGSARALHEEEVVA